VSTVPALNWRDFNLHGILGIRVIGAGAHELAAIGRQLGSLEGPLEREPEIVIRFVDRLETPGLRYLGLEDAAFTDDAFLVLRGRHKSQTRVQLPMDQVGGRCEIVCERGLPAVPLLIPIVNLTALAQGALPLHAAAFVYRDRGVLATGWSKGGKTETLLAFMAAGASYVGDEWVYVSADGRRMSGIGEPIRIWDWHLTELPGYRARLSAGQKARLAGLRPALGGLRRLGAGRGPAGGFARRLEPLLRGQHGVDVPPARLFGPERCRPEASLDQLILVVSHEAEAVEVRPILGEEVARRMHFSVLEEFRPLLSAYRKFRFAFPDRANERLDCLQAEGESLFHRAFAGRKAHVLYHPYPAPIGRMFAAAEPVVAGDPGGN
jgi:hypothetical protein